MCSKRPGIRLIVRHRVVGVAIALLHGLAAALAQAPPNALPVRPDSLDKVRFWSVVAAGTTAYAVSLSSLQDVWYKAYPRAPFHPFDDRREWLQMDKAGHAFSAYFLSDWAYGVLRWSGVNRSASIWAGMGSALIVMTSVEVLDGHSAQWGFSWSDMAANAVGTTLWGVQQAVWDEQRVRLKVSGHTRKYPNDIVFGSLGGITTLRQRADDLFGARPQERFLKDYNAQTIWLSGNIRAFIGEDKKFPGWLNVAIGCGAENLYGGFSNAWTERGETFSLSPETYPRYRQWYIGPDVDLSRIRTRSKPLRLLLGMLNIVKVPSPALILSREKGVQFTWWAF